MKPTSKTPYEIRLELLQLAFEICAAKHKAAGVKNADNQITSPTTEEVIQEADKMNVFISKANTSH